MGGLPFGCWCASVRAGRLVGAEVLLLITRVCQILLAGVATFLLRCAFASQLGSAKDMHGISVCFFFYAKRALQKLYMSMSMSMSVPISISMPMFMFMFMLRCVYMYVYVDVGAYTHSPKP